MTDDREADILRRTEEILAATPTPEELAEFEERRRANRVAAIMAPPEPAPVVVHKVRENGLIEPRPPNNLREWWAQRCGEVSCELRRLRPHAQLERLLVEIATVSMVHSDRRKELEQRVAVLEQAAAKPRYRVPAGRRVL